VKVDPLRFLLYLVAFIVAVWLIVALVGQLD
jgi:hypothetical protein